MKQMFMESKKIKVAMITNHFGITGIGTVMLNYCKTIDRNRFDLTIIAGKPIAVQNKLECEQNYIKLIELPSRHEKPLAHYFRLYLTMRKNKYDIVHVHGNSSMMAVELTLAGLAGVKKRIAHSHHGECPSIRVHKLLSPYFRKVYTKALACGTQAGNWLFGEGRFEVLPNSFWVDRFYFDVRERQRVRKELHIESGFVIGHVGRFNEYKNHSYLLEVFEGLASKRPDALLLLVGTGPNFDKIKDLAEKHPFGERIIFYGETDNTSALYSAMDVFVLPSRCEGFPVVLLEAQISGLPCVVSDKVTKEVDFGDICWESIEKEPKVWAAAVLKQRLMRGSEREDYFRIHRKYIEEYDVRKTVIQLEQIYESVQEFG